mmetsp:Transcript_22950/g.58648  ORF Transcript_22950/g.58648 Transcript_22950/m.58648 type:complete len:276 (+) Transcript_22950:126-953(+)
MPMPTCTLPYATHTDHCLHANKPGLCASLTTLKATTQQASHSQHRNRHQTPYTTRLPAHAIQPSSQGHTRVPHPSHCSCIDMHTNTHTPSCSLLPWPADHSAPPHALGWPLARQLRAACDPGAGAHPGLAGVVLWRPPSLPVAGPGVGMQGRLNWWCALRHTHTRVRPSQLRHVLLLARVVRRLALDLLGVARLKLLALGHDAVDDVARGVLGGRGQLHKDAHRLGHRVALRLGRARRPVGAHARKVALAAVPAVVAGAAAAAARLREVVVRRCL